MDENQWSKDTLDKKLWSDECFTYYNLCCEREVVKERLEEIQKEFPYLKFGTQIEKTVIDDKNANFLYVTVKRFKTRELCLRHSTLSTNGWDNDG